MAESFRSFDDSSDDDFADYLDAVYTPEELRPTWQEWLKHSILFFLTLVTTTIAGLLPPFGSKLDFPDVPVPSHWIEWLAFVPYFYGHFFAIVLSEITANPTILFDGLTFSLSLLAILTAHEFGHYIACRLYRVKSTLPYFIPTPPLIGPAGTLGAVIRIQSPMPSQRAIFDIGVAGPLAGFAVIVPLMILGLATMQIAPPSVDATGGLTFADPLVAKLFGSFLGVDPAHGVINPFYAAAWLGTLITSLNLLPAGQLDGGHAVFAVLGERAHFWIGRLAFVAMVILTILGWELYGSPSTLLFTILLGALLRLGHPPPLTDEPLNSKRRAIAFFTLIVFILSFMPFPLQISP